MLTHALSRDPHAGPAWRASILSQGLGLTIPLILGLYWPLFAANASLASNILRPGMLGLSAMLAIMWSGAKLTWAETHLLKILALVCVVILIPTLLATDVSRALQDWTKLVVLSLIALLLCRGLRHPPTARALGFSLIAAALIAAGLTLYVYVGQMGFTLPTYTAVRIFKGVAQRSGVSLNSVAFTAVFSYICGMSLLPAKRLLALLGVGILGVTSAFTGSRAPLAVMAAAAAILLVFNGAGSKRLMFRVLAWLSIALTATTLVLGSQELTFKQMSDFTEGRWDLWYVASQKFAERPLTGFGYESWRDDITSRLPGDHQRITGGLVYFEGGYHNEYLTLLAEQGILGFAAVGSFFLFLLNRSFRLAFRAPVTWHNRQWALFGCLFLLLRATVEIPGLFGYGQEPADFLAFLFVAIVFSRFSVEEDHLRGLRQLNRFEQLPREDSEITLAVAT